MFTQENGMNILKALYDNKYDEVDYESVDEFYAFLGYDLELFQELQLLNINGTSDLLESFEKLEEF